MVKLGITDGSLPLNVKLLLHIRLGMQKKCPEVVECVTHRTSSAADEDAEDGQLSFEYDWWVGWWSA